MAESTAIGIDLGTTFSVVAVWRKDRIHVIPNKQSHRITPSCVAFTDEEVYIGEPALSQLTRNPKNTVFDVKRLIGRNFNDPVVQEDRKDWLFTVVDVEGKPRIQVEYMKETKLFAPEEISAMVLRNMKEIAMEFLGEDVKNVKDAVITVPASFNNAQRQATIDAGKIAGLNVLRIINEPTAAALAYGLDTNPEGERNVLIYDLGGGTFDVSIVTIEQSKFTVRASRGDPHLGGGDFDNLLVDFLLNKVDKNRKDIISSDHKAKCKLKSAAEKAKINLSSTLAQDIYIDSLVNGYDFSYKLSLATFENLCSHHFRKTLQHVEDALADAEMNKDNIDDVVLVGGSTRITKVRSMLQEFFTGKELKATIDPDEAIAYGAAIEAARGSNVTSEKIKDVLFKDISAYSIGVEVYGGWMGVVIKRNISIPCSVSEEFFTEDDQQRNVIMKIYEGEERKVKDNHFLGEFQLYGIPPAPAGVGSVMVTCNLNENGILTVTAVEKITRKSESLVISMKKKGLATVDIERMCESAATTRAQNASECQRVGTLDRLQRYAQYVKTAVEDAGDDLDEAEKNDARRLSENALSWADMDSNKSASKEVLEERLERLQKSCSKLMAKITLY